MIDKLEKNIDTEIEMLKEILEYLQDFENVKAKDEKRILRGAVDSLKSSIKTINNAVPEMLNEIKLANKLPSGSRTGIQKAELAEVTFKRDNMQNFEAVLKNKDKENFFRELSINENYIKRIKKGGPKNRETYEEFKRARGYLRIANKFFLKQSTESVNKGKYKGLSVGIRKANFDILLEGYIAMMYFTTFIAGLISVFLTVILLFVDFGFSWPIFELYTGSYLARFARIFWIPLIIPALTFLIVYYYPTTEQKAIERKINDELPFAVIHMSAISGSGIEPSQIFRIIGMSSDYPALRREIRKIINQVNLYGYDLITALNNSAKTSPSERLAELFSGISTTITSGARLEDFLEKRAESLLITYRLEREQYTKLVETVLDIYISIVVAAPMIFLLIITMLSVTEAGIQIEPWQISLAGVFGVAVLNIIFLIFIQLKQPSY